MSLVPEKLMLKLPSGRGGGDVLDNDSGCCRNHKVKLCVHEKEKERDRNIVDVVVERIILSCVYV